MPTYTHEQAQKDFQRIAAKFDLSDEVVAAGLARAKKYAKPDDDGVVFLAEAMIEANSQTDYELSDALEDKEGFLRQFTIASEDQGRYLDDLEEFLDDEAKSVADGAVVIARMDADAWIEKGGEVFRVHPEGVTKLGDYLAYMNKQIDLACSD